MTPKVERELMEFIEAEANRARRLWSYLHVAGALAMNRGTRQAFLDWARRPISGALPQHVSLS